MIATNKMDLLLYRSSPQYCEAYKDGFETMKHLVLQDLSLLIKRVKELEALSGCTDTATTDELYSTIGTKGIAITDGTFIQECIADLERQIKATMKDNPINLE